MHDFNEYIKRRIPGMINMSIRLNDLMSEKFDTIIKKTSVIIDFYTLQFNKDAQLVIPIGTKDSPTGISRVNDSYIIITHTDNRPLFYVHSEELKAWIRSSINHLEKVHSEDFKLAVVVKYGQLVDDTTSKSPIFFKI